jgi:hypothetical protein
MLLMGLFPMTGKGAMTVRYYSPMRHDRFYRGNDKDFVGASYDFSGVGIGNLGHWAILVSDSCFLSAYHLHPADGEIITYWSSNELSGPHFTYVVTGGARIGKSDLWVGWFDKSVNVDASIARYPIPFLPSVQNYYGLLLYNYGVSHRVGRNVLDLVAINTVGSSTGFVMLYDYDFNDFPFVGGDETCLVAGDSGAPSFTVFNAKLYLIGIHWASTKNPTGSQDTFVPMYFDEINKILSVRGQTLLPYRIRPRYRLAN